MEWWTSIMGVIVCLWSRSSYISLVYYWYLFLRYIASGRFFIHMSVDQVWVLAATVTITIPAVLLIDHTGWYLRWPYFCRCLLLHSAKHRTHSASGAPVCPDSDHAALIPATCATATAMMYCAHGDVFLRFICLVAADMIICDLLFWWSVIGYFATCRIYGASRQTPGQPMSN